MANETKQKAPRRYEKMRDSGVEWIGMVPEHWNVERLQWHLEEINHTNNPVKTANILSLTNKLGVVPYEEKGNQGNKAKENLSDYKLAYPNCIVANSMNILIGSVGLCNYFGCVSPVYYVFKAKDLNDIRFFNYVFGLTNFQKELRKYANGILEIRLRVSASNILKRRVAIPPYSEQLSIADFLDNIISKIDSIIAEAKASIEEYKAWKSSIIYEAVTKGLDPTAEMKDSGVEWIGKIPAHWAFGKIKRVAQFAPKCDFSRLKDDVLITFTPMECIRNGYFENRGKQLNTITGSYTPYSEGDIVFAKVTPCFENGNICIMKNLYSGVGLGSSELFVLRAHSINTEYLFYYLQHPGFVQRACASMTGTGGLKRVSGDFVQNCPLPIPPEEEQHKIVDFLNRRCTAIEQLISDKNALLEELESYKKSLIHEVVTGKRKVV